MKLKKKYKVILTIFIIAFIGLSVFFITKKKKITTTTKTSSANKYLVSFENDFSEHTYSNGEKCDKYNGNLGTAIYKDDNSGFPIYVVEGCASEIDFYIKKTGDSSNACNIYKSYVENEGEGWNRYSESIVNEYNNKCGSISGTITQQSLPEEMTDEGCKKLKDNIEHKYVDYRGWEDYYERECDGNLDIKKDPYYSNNSCESLKFPDLFTGVLKKSDSRNTCGYDLYYINGYATTFDDYWGHVNDSDKSNFCAITRDRLYSSYVENMSSAEAYDSYCSGLGYPTRSSNTFKNNVTATTAKSGSCASYINIYNGVLAPTIALPAKTSGNQCDYIVYYYQGQPWEFYPNDETGDEGIIGKSDVDVSIKKELCSAKYDEIKGTNNGYDDFNYYCVDSGYLDSSYKLEIEPTIDIIFTATNADGLECRDISNENYSAGTSGTNECTYHVKKSWAEANTLFLGTNELPDTSGLKQDITNFKFKGWKRSDQTSCDTTITINFPDILSKNDIDVLYFSPCYEESTVSSDLTYTLYQTCDGDKLYQDNTTGDENVKNSAILTSTITETKYYASSQEKSETISHGNSFKLNSFCTITCDERVDYKYPTVFETVKAGTYFDLLSYPEIKSRLFCTEHFDYNNWKNAYKIKIENEMKAYADYLTSKSIEDMTFSYSSTCGCASRNPDTGACTSYYDRYKGYATKYTVSNSGDFNNVIGTITESTQAFSYCDSSGSETTARNSAKSSYRVNSGNSTTYKNRYETSKKDRELLQTANTDCAKALSVPSADEFYKPDPKISLFYEDTDSGKNTKKLDYDPSKYHEEELGISSNYKKDSGVHDWNEDTWEKETIPISISYKDKSFNFNSIKTRDTFVRQVTRNFVFTHSASHPVYYTKIQDGTVTTSNVSGKTMKIGYVYPVSLSTTGSRNIYFGIKYPSNLNYGAKTVINTNPSSIRDKNVYSCDYEITNDIIVVDKDDSDKFKKNFYIRSVETSNIDPNDRYNSGLLGANWASEKGQALKELIQSKSEGNNTYNPDNLEYSFTINAQTIDAIREYNKSNDYDDFLLTCNNLGGECESKFLKGLYDNKLDSIPLNNVNAYMKKKTDPTWKYYIDGKWRTLKKLTDYPSTVCTDKSDYKKFYECLYKNENEGILP